MRFKRKLKKPFYWKATKDDRTFFFLGTMHVGFQLDDLPESIKNDIASSGLLAVEVDRETLKEVSEALASRRNEYNSRFAEYYTQLQNSLSPKAWERLCFTLISDDVQKYIKSLGIKHPSNEIHPVLVKIVVLHFGERRQNHVFHPELLKGNSRYDELSLLEEKESILDKEIEKYALEKDVRVIGLDNIGQVAGAIYPKNKDLELKTIEYIFGSEEKLKGQLIALKKLQAIYRSSDEKSLIDSTDDLETNEDALYNDRNKHWFDQLNQLEEKQVFVAVGARHFVGEENLLNLFRDRDFKIEKILRKN